MVTSSQTYKERIHESRPVVVTILAIIGVGWNVFVSGTYVGVQKIMGNSSILKKMTEKAQQLVGNITKKAHVGVLKRQYHIVIWGFIIS
jgi:hypothetical protein